MENVVETKGLNVGYRPTHVIYDFGFEAPDSVVIVGLSEIVSIGTTYASAQRERMISVLHN